MTTRLQKLIDNWVGLPLCTLLAGFVTVDPHTPLPQYPRTILVGKFFGLGSIALQLPLLRALRARYPVARLVFLTFAGNRRLLELSGLCDEIITVRPSPARSFATDCIRCLLRLRALRPEVGIDLEFFSKFAQLMCWLSGARFRLGLERREFWRERFYHRMVPIAGSPSESAARVHGKVANNHHSEPPNAPVVLDFDWRHILEVYGDLARAAGVECYDEAMPSISLPESAHAEARGFLAASGGRAGERLLVVNVNASDLVLGRRWPAEKFAELIEWLAVGDGRARLLPSHNRAVSVARREPRPPRVVLTGTAGEFAYTESVRAILSLDAQPRVINAAGKLSLDAFLAVLTKCDLLLTNDTGPLHLAALMGTPTVSLWGPGSPEMYGPRATHHSPLSTHHTAVYERYWCSPCMYLHRVEPGAFCNFAFPCVRGLEVERVKEAVQAALAD